MAVLRIVADLHAENPQEIAQFYHDLLGLKIAMDMGFVVTLAEDGNQPPQVSIMSEGGSGTPTPHLSIEVDDLDAVLVTAKRLDLDLEYGPTDEPWGVRRFFVRDPAGRLLNILTHRD
jgi:catechol 2,3-dioxygenase-like lactoylglutathione lyase family enzyme